MTESIKSTRYNNSMAESTENIIYNDNVTKSTQSTYFNDTYFNDRIFKSTQISPNCSFRQSTNRIEPMHCFQ